MRTLRNRNLNKMVAGVLAITLSLIVAPANSACAATAHPLELPAAATEHSHHAMPDTRHADHQPRTDSDTASLSCCDTQCQCLSSCSAVLAVIGSLSVSNFELLQPLIDTFSGGDTQPVHTLPFRPPIYV